MFRCSRLALPLTAALLPLPALAEDAAQNVIVVSATATEHGLASVPASVSIITAEDLAIRPVQDLAEALEGAPGITIGGVGMTRRGISIRGMSSEHALILIDGRRVNVAGSAMAHADFDLGWVPVTAIERIEVVRGALSSLYGSEALAGVINVITRRPTQAWEGSVMSSLSLQEGDGGNAYQFGAYLGGPLVRDKLSLAAWGEWRRRAPTPGRDDQRLSELEGREALSGNLSLRWTPTAAQEIDLSYQIGEDDRWRDAVAAGRVPVYYEYRDQVERQQLSVSHRGTWGWGTTQVRAYRSRLERLNERSDNQAPAAPQTMTDDVIDGYASVPLGGWQTLTFGGEWRHERLEDATVSLRGRRSTDHGALFVQDELKFGDRASLVLGSRFDHHEAYGWETSPRAYLVYHPLPNLTLRGGVGQGFKAPTLKQLSPEYRAIGGGGRFTIVGNPELEPEISTSYELGAEYRAQNWSLRGTLYQNDLDNLIQTYCTAFCGLRGQELRAYQNVDRARVRGIELGGKATLLTGLTLDVNYTYADAEDRRTGQALAERPAHSGNLRLSWAASDALTLDLRGRYVGRQTIYDGTRPHALPAYDLWSLSATYAITPAVVLRGGVENIADTHLAEESGLYSYAEPGRIFHLGLSARF